MPVRAGQTLLHYRIVDKLGEGGMGQVWRAVDTTLDREVAIKVLPGTFAADPDRLGRFEREAKLLASLNHTNIATIHGLHTAQDGTSFLVMEIVPGEDLAQRISRGPLPVEQALPLARQITDALAAAHASGIIHRDLKPANIRVTPGGKIKVLDFGLAKGAVETSGDPTLSPTVTSAGTQAGMVLGTAAYMSPEQAKGHVADRRADIWAFGVVLYEMLTGRGAFRGDSIADTMASVLKLEPDFGKLPPGTPAGLLRLLRRCLRKDPDRRLHDIADARIEIDEVDLDVADSTPPPSPRRAGGLALLGAVALGLVGGALLHSALTNKAPSTSAPGAGTVVRSLIPMPPGKPLMPRGSLAISRDGSVMALNVGFDEHALIYVRRLDSLEMEPIPGTEGAQAPFFSPDGEQLGFLADGQVKKVSLRGTGRDVTVLCDAPVSNGGTWDTSGWIYFTFGESRLARVREDGGEREELGEAGDVHHVQALPDGRGILLTVNPNGSPSNRKDTATIAVLLPDGKTVKPVFEGGYSARYLSSGYLVFMRAGGLFAVPFDLDRLEASPPAASVQPDVFTDSIWALARYDVSPGGTLVYAAGGNFAYTAPTWVDLETGKEEALPVPPGVFNTFNLSPDGKQLAIQSASGAQDHVYVYDSTRGTFTRLTLEGANTYPVWSHDGREVFFGSSRGGQGYRLYRKPVDGSAPASRMLTDEQEAQMGTDSPNPSSVTPDGEFLLAFTWGHPTQGGDLWKVPLNGTGDPEVLLSTPANEIIPQISPDGKWLAYLSDRAGDYRIMVRPFPDVERREWVISGDDAYDPRWSARGDALLFRRGWGRLMRVPVEVGDGFTPGMEQELIEIDFHDAAGSSFAVSPDDKRVLVNKPVNVSARDETPVTLVTGWAGEVARKLRSN